MGMKTEKMIDSEKGDEHESKNGQNGDELFAGWQAQRILQISGQDGDFRRRGNLLRFGLWLGGKRCWNFESRQILEMFASDSLVDPLHVADKSIAAARNGFDITRAFGAIGKNFPEALDAVIETVFEVDERVGGPEATLKFFTGDQFAGPLGKNLQYLVGLFLKLQANAMLTKFLKTEVQFVVAEADGWAGMGVFCH